MVPSPEKREKKVYFCIEKFREDCPNYRTGTYEWYAIIDNDDTVEGEEPNKLVKPPEVVELKPVFDSPCDSNSHHYLCGFAAWKSFICIFGGCDVSDPDFTPLSNVFYIDTSYPPDWKRGPNLLKPRDSPYGVVFNGKIWALGGSPDLSPIYGESLQSPFSDSWVPLYMGGGLNKNTGVPNTVAGHAIYSNKLFVYGTPTKALHCYDIKARKWSVAVKNFGYWQYECAFIGEMMYLVEGRKFMGFDLKTNEWYKGVGLKKDTMLPFTIEESEIGFGVFSTLVHIGNGILCLLWSSRVTQDYSIINCTKFTVFKEYDNTEASNIIRANVRSFKLYKTHVGFLAASLAVRTGEGNDHAQEEDEVEKSAKKKKSQQKFGN